MAILDDFLTRTKSKVYTAENKPLFLIKALLGFIAATHLLMLPRFVAETDWEVLHSLMLFLWLTLGAIATVLSYGAFLVVMGLWFFLGDYVEKFLQVYVLSDWFKQGMGTAWASVWGLCLVGLPVLFMGALLAWNTWSEAEQEALENKEE
jgi:hypothetical protein